MLLTPSDTKKVDLILKRKRRKRETEAQMCDSITTDIKMYANLCNVKFLVKMSVYCCL